MRGNPWGCAKWPKWAKMASIGKIMKKMIKEIMEFPISCIKTMHLHFTHHIKLEKNVKMPWGGPWECTNVGKAIFPF